MVDILTQIRSEYPNLKIILGADANHYMGIDKNGQARVKDLKIFPNDLSAVTTAKKRTAMQPQTHKSNLIVM